MEEFKQQAIDLANSLGSKKAAERLGIPAGSISNWKYRKKLKTGPRECSPAMDSEQELAQLRKEVGELRRANHILKAAAAFFSQDHLK